MTKYICRDVLFSQQTALVKQALGSKKNKMNSIPKCIIVTGRPGSGKTTLSKKLGQILYLPVISRDEIKEGYVNTFRVKHDKLPPESNGIASEFFMNTVIHFLENKVSVVIEAAFSHGVWESRISDFMRFSEVFFIICSIDGEIAANRHLQRGLNDSKREFFHGDKRVSVYRSTGIVGLPDEYQEPVFPVPTIRVSTIDSYSPDIGEIGEFINIRKLN